MKRRSSHPDPAPLTALVVGGGIAGLTAAVALRRDGHDVEVVERMPEWPATGWGLSLTGPALRGLADLDLLDACIEAGFGMSGINNCDVHGRVLHEVEPPSLLGPGRPVMVGIGRPALSHVLREAASGAGVTLTLGTTAVRLDQSDDSVSVELSDGSRRTVDLVVAADGVNSPTRAQLGMDVHPEFLGQRTWRTTVRRPAWVDRLHTFNAERHSSGIVPLSHDRAYVFTTETTPDQGKVSDQDLVESLRRLLAPLEGDMAQIREEIVDPAEIVERSVVGLLVDGSWHRGRAVLIGDAVHTCAPHMVSGSTLAVEDGVVLAESLAQHESVEEALTAFEQRRLPRARLVVDASRNMVELEHEHRYAEEHVVQQAAFNALAQAA